MLIVFLCLTKPAFMRRPWRITPCPAIHGWAFLCFMCIILQYLNSFASRLHEGVPPAAFTVSRFSYAVTEFSFVYALTLQQSKSNQGYLQDAYTSSELSHLLNNDLTYAFLHSDPVIQNPVPLFPPLTSIIPPLP